MGSYTPQVLLSCALSDLGAAAKQRSLGRPVGDSCIADVEAPGCDASLPDPSSIGAQSVKVGELALDEEIDSAAYPSRQAKSVGGGLGRLAAPTSDNHAHDEDTRANSEEGNEHVEIGQLVSEDLDSFEGGAGEFGSSGGQTLHRRTGWGECPYLCTKEAACTTTIYNTRTSTQRRTRWTTSTHRRTVTGVLTRVVAAPGVSSCLANAGPSGISECTFKARHALAKRQDEPPVTASLKTKIVMHTGGL